MEVNVRRIVVPSLSGNGWLTDPKEQMGYMMAAVLTSDYSQSTIFAGRVVSLPWIVAQNQNNKYVVVEKLQSSLEEMFKRVFDTVTCVVSADNGTDVKYNLNIDLSVTKNGKGYSLLSVANIENGVLKTTIDQVNGE